jgi:hypothetical protein
MRVGRLILVVATLVTILLFPLLVKDAIQALRLPSAYAAPSFFDTGGRVFQNGNFNDPNNDDDDDANNENDDESDNAGEDNENEAVECFVSLNDNEPVPCDFQENDNDVVGPPPAGGAPGAPAGGPVPAGRRCFAAGTTGDLTLTLEGGSIVVRVVSPGLPQAAWVSLDDLESLSGIPAPPAGATMLDRMIWRLEAGSGCDGPAAAQLPGAVNLGIPYSISADKSKLQIVILKGGVWQEVPTVPDSSPTNPYISATIQETGVYAVIQKP